MSNLSPFTTSSSVNPRKGISESSSESPMMEHHNAKPSSSAIFVQKKLLTFEKSLHKDYRIDSNSIKRGNDVTEGSSISISGLSALWFRLNAKVKVGDRVYSGPCWAIQGPRSVLPAGQLGWFRGHWVNMETKNTRSICI